MFLIIAAIYILAPLVFMFTASVMPAGDIMKMPYRWIPKGFYWQNYWQGIRGNDGSFIYLRNIFNSLVVASIVTMTTVFLSALTGYGLAKFHFRGRYVVFMMILATMMIPFEVIMIPLYLIITKLGIQNSYAGLITPFLVTAFGIFLMRQYYVTFPDEILDAGPHRRGQSTENFRKNNPAQQCAGTGHPCRPHLLKASGTIFCGRCWWLKVRDENDPSLHCPIHGRKAYR